MSEVGYGTLQIIPSAKGFSAALAKEVSPQLSGLGKKEGTTAGGQYKSGILGSLKGIAGPIAAAFAGVQVFSFLKDSVGEAREAQKVGAITAQTIKATGGAAKISADQVGDLAGAISAKTGIDDEAIQSGANLLLTFKNVRNEVGKGSDIFDRATQAATDLSAAGFGDLAGTSKQLGKALNDPIKGISALSKAGVTFTAQQQTQIKAMVKNGDLLGAQKIILGEVEAQVGGVAAASATFGDKATVAFGNIKESVGTALLPVLDRLGTFFVEKLAPGIQSFITTAVGGFRAFGAAWAAFDGDITSSGFAGFMERLAFIAKTVWVELTGGIRAFAAAFKAGDGDITSSGFPGFMERAAFVARQAFDIFKGKVIPALQTIGSKIVSNVVPGVISLVKAVAPLVVSAVKLGVTIGQKVLPVILKLAGIVGGAILTTFKTLATFVGDNATTFQAMAVAIGAGLVVWKAYQLALATGAAIMKGISAVTKAFAVAQGILNAVMALNPILLVVIALAALAAGLVYAYTHSAKFREIVDGAFHAVQAAAAFAWNWIKANWPLLLAIVTGPIGLAVLLITKNWDTIKAGASAVLSGIKTAFKAVVDFFTGLPGKIATALGNAVTWLVSKGKDFITGLWNGVKNAAVAYFTWWANLPGTVLSKLGALGSYLGGKGKDLLNGLKNGVTTAAVALYTFFSDLPGKAKTKLGNLGDSLRSAGKDFAQGFINGIGDLVSSAANKAKDLANAAKNAITGALGIHSPSVVATGLGRFFGQGFANGILDTSGLVSKASTGMATAAVQGALPIGSASRNGAIPGGAAPTPTANGVRDINVYGVEDPQAAAREVARKLANSGV